MRSISLLFLAALVALVARWVVTGALVRHPVAVAAVPSKPVPQDPGLSAKLAADRLEWQRRTLGGAYDRIGRRDPRWDDKARDALEKAARMFALQVDPSIHPADVYAPAKAAVDAGCDDPMVLYLYDRAGGVPESAAPEDSARRWEEAATALEASEYPAVRKAFCHRIAAAWRLFLGRNGDEASRKLAREHYDAALALLPGADVGDVRGPVWESQWFDLLVDLIASYRETGLEAEPALERVDAALARTPELEALRLKLRGKFWFDYGWEARTMAFAPGVPQGGFAKLEERLEKAREALEKSYSIRPDSTTARMLVDLDKAVGGDRGEMEKWFERALTLDPDDRDACWGKLDWLDPKWHGSTEEMIAFGRACGATGNWRTGITLLAADAHYRYVCRFPFALAHEYLGDPDVWSDVGPAYDEYLKHRPDDDVARSKYAVLCFLAGRPDQAHAHFQTLGDRLTRWPNFPNLTIEAMRTMRDQAAAAAGRANRAAPPAAN